VTRTQYIRISQYIITYGPGAILETRYGGPRIILSPDIGLRNLGLLKEYEISDARMKRLIGQSFDIESDLEPGVFRIPSNAELGKPEDEPVYMTKGFPEWRLCKQLDLHRGRTYILFRGRRCPACGQDRGLRDQPPVRFISICPLGHMDEVDWHAAVHGAVNAVCDVGYFIWAGAGSLNNIRLICPRCGKLRILGDAYREEFECSGRLPERERPDEQPNRPRNCPGKSRIVPRQASNVRIPEIRTLFTIPPSYTELHALLQKYTAVCDVVIAHGENIDMTKLESALKNLVRAGRIPQAVKDTILSYPLEEIIQAIKDNLSPIATAYSSLLEEEFKALKEGSEKGIPPVQGRRTQSPPYIEINPYLVRKVTYSGYTFRVVPVLHLRAVTVQVGYRRIVSQLNERLVDISVRDNTNKRKWYPGIEQFGEGLFIMLEENDGWHPEVIGRHSHEWMKAFNSYSADKYPIQMFRDKENIVELHPAFVWWHTLSHLLIRSVAFEAGYSSSSIRERVYLELADGKARGGILLYAVQLGSDGTFGGLIALTPYFEKILERASELLVTCSCDPLCIETRFRSGMVNGAACYGCLLLSETSCEHRNMWLDRNVLIECMRDVP
jgi:hypothetical protein